MCSVAGKLSHESFRPIQSPLHSVGDSLIPHTLWSRPLSRGQAVGSDKHCLGEHQLAASVFKIVLGMEGHSQITSKLYLSFPFQFQPLACTSCSISTASSKAQHWEQQHWCWAGCNCSSALEQSAAEQCCRSLAICCVQGFNLHTF